ncbi:ANK1 [Symbiodinium pilosum]|uniref:ANK1 protein n=1 Tax=Symbiodinium pilosum TaxID=2952 RepID=A0A812YFP3_SYMPI|nr:ANK1 [Symbiodinium pilosum]
MSTFSAIPLDSVAERDTTADVKMEPTDPAKAEGSTDAKTEDAPMQEKPEVKEEVKDEVKQEVKEEVKAEVKEEPKVEEEPEDILGFLRPFYSPIGGPYGQKVERSEHRLPPMLRVFLASGRELAALSANDLQAGAEGLSSVLKLKEYLSGLTGHPRFRQRVLCGNRQMGEDESLELPLSVQLVVVSFRDASEAQMFQLQHAVFADKVAVVEELLSVPLDPNMCVATPSPRALLHLAAHAGSLHSAKLLLEASADKEGRMPDGFTPLHCATDAEDNFGLTPLHLACLEGKLAVVRYFVESLRLQNMLARDGSSPLNIACRAATLDVVCYLISARADINHLNSSRETPLNAASRHGHLEVVRCLLLAGADAGRAPGRCTPIAAALGAGHLEVARLLGEAQAAPKRRRLTFKQPGSQS